jgi:hypothetical protein
MREETEKPKSSEKRKADIDNTGDFAGMEMTRKYRISILNPTFY